jgi:tRNA U34 2-thiouridine synthase MnmA/TrmU
MNKNKKYAVLSLSGGMDSSTLLLHLLANNYEVKGITSIVSLAGPFSKTGISSETIYEINLPSSSESLAAPWL